MKLSRVKNISLLLFRELIRDKVFSSLSGAAVLLVFATLILNEMVVGQEIKATKDLGLSLLNLFSLFILIFLGVHMISKDIGNKTLYLLFSKSVKRSEYLLSSFTSILLTVITGILAIGATILLLAFIQGEIWLFQLLIVGYFTLLEMVLLLVFAILFALIVSPQLAMFLTLLLYIIGHSLEQAAQVVAQSANIVLKYFIIICYSILPNLEYFNIKQEVIYGLNIPPFYIFNATLYSLSYALLIFLLCIYVFKKKEI